MDEEEKMIPGRQWQEPAEPPQGVEDSRIDVLQQRGSTAERISPERHVAGQQLGTGLQDERPIVEKRVPPIEAATRDQQFAGKDQTQNAVGEQKEDSRVGPRQTRSIL
jgi:hypothetical protein